MVPTHLQLIRGELGKMLQAGIIKSASSSWSSPVVISTKEDKKPWFSIDYRALNAKMKGDRWPIPQIEEIFDDLQGLEYFFTLDLFYG